MGGVANFCTAETCLANMARQIYGEKKKQLNKYDYIYIYLINTVNIM